jgi:cob(I)alamin adenosyltransferase
MGKRLTKIVTRTGDDGTTGLGDGTRVDKSSLRVEVLGDIDELNSLLGVLLSGSLPDDIHSLLIEVQHDLFDLGGEMCMPGRSVVERDHVARLDTWIKNLNASLPSLKEFILPGGCPAASIAHLARSVCRRAERQLVRLARSERIEAAPLQYLNRLSDLLFILARSINQAAGASETYWRSRRMEASARVAGAK